MKTQSLILLLVFPLLFACDPPGSSEEDDAPAGQGAPEAATKEQPTKVAILLAEGFQDAEAFMPMGYLTNHGCEVTVVGIKKGKVKAYNSDFTVDIQKSVSDLSVADFDALVLPGGKGPAELREHSEVLDFVKAFDRLGKPIAAVCHGPQVLISAGLLDGRSATGVEGIKDELIEAGVDYRDEALVIDGHFITSRVPEDLPGFSKAIAEAIDRNKTERKN